MKTRRWIAGLAVASLLLGSAGISFAAQTVPGAVYGDQQAVGVNKPAAKVQEDLQKAGIQDVKADHWAAGSITVLVEAGLLAPDTQGNLKPDSTTTTEEGVAVFAKVLGIASKTDDPATATQKAKEAGLLDAGVDGKDQFSRMEVARLIARALGVQPKLFVDRTTYPFNDYDAVQSQEDRAVLAALYEMGVFKGYEDRTFRPGGILTKAQLAILIDRILGVYN